MTEREKNFCRDLAKFMCFSDAFEIGREMRNIIRNMTKLNKAIRNEVLVFCKDFVHFDEYNSDLYGEDKQHALKQIKEDYDCVFYK